MEVDFTDVIPMSCPTCKANVDLRVPMYEPQQICPKCGETFRPDEELMKDFYGCHDDAVWKVEQLHQASVLRYLVSRQTQQVTAEEIELKVFDEVFRSKDIDGSDDQTAPWDPKGGRSFKNWMMDKTKKRLLSQQIRKQTTPISAMTNHEDKGVLTIEDQQTVDSLENAFGTPLDHAVATEHRETVNACKAQLDEREAIAVEIWLTNAGDRGTNNEVARELDCSPATATRVLSRALESLLECLRSKGISDADLY